MRKPGVLGVIALLALPAVGCVQEPVLDEGGGDVACDDMLEIWKLSPFELTITQQIDEQ